ncbi:caspase family protein [Bradyrhizobium sp.]|uniref:caspase family protein n=1 Tax=Bradyrhizobium sp. TaxID=376 RepID=UPI001EB7F089|nr:caspase family protein [Bradyrhizobium sp.]MBV8918782.1 caspase family protein [Bradyrhizobium sp.]MBV9985945.1 caspase family protein [Bradyrhizobium sp.]
MFPRVLCAALALAAFAATSDAARAENRLALVIGQSAYRAVTALPNPANDANAISKLLTDAGFDVTLAADLTQKDMNEKVGDFAAKIATRGPDTVALLFYAGHGLQVDGENYLVPVDVDPKRETDIPLQAVRLNDVLNTLNAVPSRMRLLLLDACRNNPFPAISPTAGHGLALVDTKSGAPGTFLSYSTAPGAVAEDGDGADSPYTTALLAAAREPNLPIEEAFKRVRVAVNKATEGRQTPWESSSLTEDFRFVAGAAAAAPAAANAGPMPAATRRSVEDWQRDLKGKPIALANETIVADGTVEACEAFVTLYTDPPFSPQARQWLDLHRRMVAWKDAVLLNTAASYRAFLAKYPDSDLTPTAQRLVERLRNRPSPLPVVAAPATVPTTPTNVALGPTCPCNAPVQPVKKADAPVKKTDADPPRRKRPPRVDDGGGDVVIYRQPPPPEVIYGPPVGVGIGIGIGGGHWGGERGGVNGPIRRY